MPKGRIQKTSPLFAAAMAVSATGLFSATGPAQALPPIPLAPGDCQTWVFPGGTVQLTQATGEVLSFTASGAVDDSVAHWKYPNGASDPGRATAGIAPDGHIEVIWYEKQGSEVQRSIEFDGDVGADGTARGVRPGSDTDVTWTSTPMKCDSAAPTSQANSREVTGDVDVYDVPGGVGTVIGMLEGGEGQRVQLGSGCKEDRWCNVVWPAGPGGTAWVWGDFLE